MANPWDNLPDDPNDPRGKAVRWYEMENKRIQNSYDPSHLTQGMPAYQDIPGGTLNFMNQLQNYKYDTGALNAIEREGMRTGPSKWAQLQGQGMRQDAAIQAQANRAQAMRNAQTAGNQLAMRGGLRGGTAERMAMEANRNQMSQQNLANAQLNRNLIGVGAQDEQNRMSSLNQAMGGRFNIDQARVSNIGNAASLGSNYASNLNQYNLGKYQLGSQLAAANRLADIQQAESDKSWWEKTFG